MMLPGCFPVKLSLVHLTRRRPEGRPKEIMYPMWPRSTAGDPYGRAAECNRERDACAVVLRLLACYCHHFKQSKTDGSLFLHT